MGSQDNLQYTSIHPFRDGKGRRLCCRFSHKIDSLMQQNVINPSTSTINGCQWRILHCLLSISVAFQAFTRLLEHQVLGDTFKACFWYSKQPKKCSRTGSMSYYVSWITNFSNFLSYFGIEKKLYPCCWFPSHSLLQKGVPMDAHKQGELALATSPNFGVHNFEPRHSRNGNLKSSRHSLSLSMGKPKSAFVLVN